MCQHVVERLVRIETSYFKYVARLIKIRVSIAFADWPGSVDTIDLAAKVGFVQRPAKSTPVVRRPAKIPQAIDAHIETLVTHELTIEHRLRLFVEVFATSL